MTDHADLAGPHSVVECSHRLLDVHRLVETVELVEVDVIGVESTQAVVEGTGDPSTGVALHVSIGAHRMEHLGGEDDVLTSAGQCSADDLLAFATRVGIGGVEEVDAAVECLVHDAHTLVMVTVAHETEHHRAEAVATHRDSGAAEHAVLHEDPPAWSSAPQTVVRCAALSSRLCARGRWGPPRARCSGRG